MGRKIGKVYGIGNPLIDITATLTSEDLGHLGIYKGTMHLIEKKRRQELLSYIEKKAKQFSCGGSCPNTIITLAALGIETTLAGKVGDDEYGSIYHDCLASAGVKDELAHCEEPTGSSIILITEDSERTMNTYLGANRLFKADDIVPQSIKDADYFHFTGYMWDTPNQKSSILRAIEIAEEGETKISFDIADPFAVGRNRDQFLSLIRDHVDLVFANSEEARYLFDNYDPRECCKSLGKLCETAIVKDGKRGSYICHQGKVIKVPLEGPAKAVDTTGAGDTYAAGFLYGLCRHLPLEASGFCASYLAGEIIQQHGAQFSKERGTEIKLFLEKTFGAL
ncbi:MAG: adenosine kinase [Sphaerochaetaceae bacterium]|jgi:sugar/nucleoside kinase (ribokinase family)